MQYHRKMQNAKIKSQDVIQNGKRKECKKNVVKRFIMFIKLIKLVDV